MSWNERNSPPKSVSVWMESSRREMREESPARERQKKKAMARNRPPPPMWSKRTGILRAKPAHAGQTEERGGGVVTR